MRRRQPSTFVYLVSVACFVSAVSVSNVYGTHVVQPQRLDGDFLAEFSGVALEDQAANVCWNYEDAGIAEVCLARTSVQELHISASTIAVYGTLAFATESPEQSISMQIINLTTPVATASTLSIDHGLQAADAASTNRSFQTSSIKNLLQQAFDFDTKLYSRISSLQSQLQDLRSALS